MFCLLTDNKFYIASGSVNALYLHTGVEKGQKMLALMP